MQLLLKSGNGPPQVDLLMPISLNELRTLAEEIIVDLAGLAPQRIADLSASMVDYHGFGKKALSVDYVSRFRSAARLDLREIQTDLVRVTTDLTDEVHFHENASAFVVVLGQREGFPNPTKAMTFTAGGWRPLAGGERLKIPAGATHGFTVGSGGLLYFLSVQSPPIHREGEEDDYHRVAGTSESPQRG